MKYFDFGWKVIVIAFPAALIFPLFLPFIWSAGVLALPTFYHRLFKHGVALLFLALITSAIVVGIWHKEIEAMVKSVDALKRATETLKGKPAPNQLIY
jgi:hypothetical protein